MARALWPDVDEKALLVAPLMARDEQLGLLCCLAHDRQFTDEDAELLGAVADQTAVGLKKAELIERLTAENIVKDMFDALAAGSVEGGRGEGGRGALRSRPRRTCSCTSSAPRAPTRACRPGRRWRAGSRRACGGSIRAPSSTPATTACARWRRSRPRTATAAEQLRAACEPLAREDGLVIGISDVDRGAASARRRMREAADAARIGRSLVAEGGAVCYEQLGAYRYLVHLDLDEAPRDRYRHSVEQLSEYDRRRGTQLIETLEQFLADRGSVTASARALYVHPNTVRQRLERIERVAGPRPAASEDLLSLELALKLARLHRVRTEAGRRAMGLRVPALATAPDRQPDPEDREADHVQEQDQQHPPGLPAGRAGPPPSTARTPSGSTSPPGSARGSAAPGR